MATIEKRITQDGAASYRVKVRRKGQPVQTATFERLTDAKKWALSNVNYSGRSCCLTEECYLKVVVVAWWLSYFFNSIVRQAGLSHRSQVKETEPMSSLASEQNRDLTQKLT